MWKESDELHELRTNILRMAKFASLVNAWAKKLQGRIVGYKKMLNLNQLPRPYFSDPIRRSLESSKIMQSLHLLWRLESQFCVQW